ncbi:MAG: SDR family oxidoreductase [Acidobacteriaceae bacterium]|jgi:3-oxoacyl-[acyl-carrier protein] reductase
MPIDPTPGVPLTLTGRTALISGGSRGIGAATVHLFRQAGARVAFSYRAAKAEAEALAAELQGPPDGPTQCLALQQSLTTPEDGQALVARTLAAFGDLDILIVNHGIWPEDSPAAAITPARWRNTLATNLDSAFGLVQAASAHMLTRPSPAANALGPIEAPRGHIILIASAAGQRGDPNHADYAASKGALISLTKSLSAELAPHAIYCNCVAPGWVSTEMSASAFATPELAAQNLAAVPLGRPAHPHEVAGPILFLCTPFAGFISGEILNANGGAVLIG